MLAKHRIAYPMVALVLVVAMFCGGLALGWEADRRRLGRFSRGPEDFGLFWEAWDRLERMFWSPAELHAERMTYGATRGMLQALGDPYTSFFEPAEHQLNADRLRGEFGGIGVQLGGDRTGVFVASVFPDSPAEAAGLLVGDILVAVGREATAGLAVDDVRLLLRGPVGSVVELTLERHGGRPVTVPIQRQEIEIPSLEWELLQPKVGYVQLRFFSDRTPKEFAQALRSLSTEGASALILDLRGNGGGVVEAAVGVLGELLGKGIAYREVAKGEAETRYPVPFRTEVLSWPLAVLVDAGTASSAEIVAAAVRDNGRGLLYGQTTFGKGSVQAVFPLEDGSSVHLTVGRWLSSDGHAIEDLGVVPDIPIGIDGDPNEDQVLQAALSDLQSGLVQQPSPVTIALLCNMKAMSVK